MQPKKRLFIELSAFALGLLLLFGSLYVFTLNIQIQESHMTTSDVNMNAKGIVVMGQSKVTLPDGSSFMLEHHDANKTNVGLDWLVNRTIGFGNNASQTMVYVGWSNSTANCGATTTHLSNVFNDSAGEGDGLGIKTLVAANWTRWTTYGKFNMTAKAYAAETITGIVKVFIAFNTGVYYNYVAIDVITPLINLPSGSIIESTFVIQFS
jgi:hypothetical protein